MAKLAGQLKPQESHESQVSDAPDAANGATIGAIFMRRPQISLRRFVVGIFRVADFRVALSLTTIDKCGRRKLVLPAKLPGNTFFHMHTISLKLPERLAQMLEAEARARRASKSAVVRECLERTLAGPPRKSGQSCFDLAQDLAGSIQGLPQDLATNPKHLDGFGR